jgi:hypothetical protein
MNPREFARFATVGVFQNGVNLAVFTAIRARGQRVLRRETYRTTVGGD